MADAVAIAAFVTFALLYWRGTYEFTPYEVLTFTLLFAVFWKLDRILDAVREGGEREQ